ncbi:lipopolysaccharide assembly LapA domain-containing protein [Corynebacterium sp. sy039]|uniref:LapA family protein n=1 Tax=Corynebacterium sp. sy039 TaxID=2599641 RepID=UPI0011B682CD|nr:lipopolysaccharide assembly protein LapA domain-containing protein [Corynebacterium sp. sy039]QDZ42822.1 DUF1049 domain-containing protein [Corynebacterium sp. sy039]
MTNRDNFSPDQNFPEDSTQHFDDSLTAQPHYTESAAAEPAYEAPVPAPEKHQKTKVKSSFAGGTWVALIVGALLLIVLLIFIMQNQQAVKMSFIAWSFSFPAGVGFLLAAIGGALIMALVGGTRILQLRRQIKKK